MQRRRSLRTAFGLLSFAIGIGIVATLDRPDAHEATEIVAGISREMIRVPFTSGKHEYQLEAMLVHKAAPGRYPLAVISHGSPRAGEDRATFSPTTSTSIAIEFARRGWATLVLMRRGYGESEGEWSEGYGSCNDPHYEAAGRTSADDISQTIRYVADHPSRLTGEGVSIDANRVLLIGVSAGGFASMAANALHAPDLHIVGVLNFAGGRGSQNPDEVCGEGDLVSAYASFGRTAMAPTLWFWAENDHFFSPTLARRMFAAFEKAGGSGELVITPAFGTDGHAQFSDAGIPNWRGVVDRFLREQHLPTWSAPIMNRLPNLAAPAGLSEKGRAEFEKYLASENFEKAFAIGDRGAYAWRTGKRTGQEAAKDALASCDANGAHCRVYAVNNEQAK